MKRRQFITLLGAAAAARPITARAQEAGKVRRLGFLRIGPPPSAWIEGLRQGLRELGYIDGRNIAIEFGLASSVAQLPEVVAELVASQGGCYLCLRNAAGLGGQGCGGRDPRGVCRRHRSRGDRAGREPRAPGGKVTGLTNTQADITGKQLQLLSELLPNLFRIAIIARATSEASARYLEEAETAARSLGVQLQVLILRDPGVSRRDLSAAQGASAVVVPDDAVFTAHRTQIAELALKNRLPFICSTREFVSAGGLMSYGPNTSDLYRRAADYVDKILRGTKPADLPVQQPIKFELVINLKTARALGIDVPATLLARADEVIE